MLELLHPFQYRHYILCMVSAALPFECVDALVGDISFMGDPMSGVTSVPYSVYGAWQEGGHAFLAKYDRAHNDVTCRYWRAVNDKLKLGTSLNVNLEKTESNVRIFVDPPMITYQVFHSMCVLWCSAVF